MDDDLVEMFTEAMSQPEGVADIEAVDDIDNPVDDGANEDDSDLLVEDEIGEDEDADTDDEPPAADDSEDDFNWEEIVERYGDRKVTLTVQGQPVEVPLKELPNGFMMREDYSRKTAEVAQERKAAIWAKDVQTAFETDPAGTLAAFAAAYGLDTAQPSQAPVADPYEDLDPDVAAVLRRLDEQEARHNQQLAQIQSRVEAEAHQKMVEEVRHEVQSLKAQYGDDFDELQVLGLAAQANIPLSEAAEMVVARQFYSKSKEQRELESQAGELAKTKSDRNRQTAKRRASGTATKKFDADSTIPADDFDTIGELFEIVANSTG